MSKKFYFVIFCVLMISVLLLGFSYSKESGKNDSIALAGVVSDKYRVIFSDGDRIDTAGNSTKDVSIINKSNELMGFKIILTEINNVEYKDVYYKINDGKEQRLINGIIELGELNKYGTNGDHLTYKLFIRSGSSEKYTFKLSVKENDKNILSNMIKNSKQVFTDKNGDIRYFGTKVNNYIRYKEQTMRIIGIVSGKVKILSDPVLLGVYDANQNYPTLNDYLGSFNNKNVTIETVLQYTSWMSDKGYWLEDVVSNQAYYASKFYGVGLSVKNVSYYIRNVYEIDVNSIIISGDGTLNSPFEVTYGS